MLTKMPRSVESRWSEVTPVLVVDHMVGISLDVFRWLREGVGRDSLWHMLADSLWPRKAGRVQHGREEWRWLKLSFGRNSNGIKDLFCNRVGEWNPASFIPQRASTPILETGRYCICNKRWRESDPTMVECTNCDNWYHVECIREDVRRVEKNDRFMCPKCASNSHIKFPSLWCNSKSVASCHGITISTIVGNSAEFIPSTIEASKEENEIIENSCKDNVNVPVPTESHDFCENQEAELCITTVLGHNQFQQSDRTQSEDFINQNVSSIGGGYCEVTDSDDDFKSPKKRVHATTTFPTWQKRKADTGDLHFENHLSESGTKKAINNGICPHDVDIGKKDDDLAEMLNAKYQDNGDHDKIVFTVRCEGTISHEKYAVKRNRIQAEIRQNIRKDLRYRQADSLATEIAGKAAPAFRRRCGNFSDVPTSDILRQIRSEVLKEHDLHQDPIIDLRERMKDDETLSNFIRGHNTGAIGSGLAIFKDTANAVNGCNDRTMSLGPKHFHVGPYEKGTSKEEATGQKAD
ncbi:unnamed protein product [Allacma fusca]|uniref:PHD-type domain-containing protein n=1 Tax=Allacma fusca TaxID=39272 RepID=A0A8J2NTQ9_9HEXA|nr:unnamed protein product [Allacma fusca]